MLSLLLWPATAWQRNTDLHKRGHGNEGLIKFCSLCAENTFSLSVIQETPTELIYYHALRLLLFFFSVHPQPLLLTGHHGEISAMTFGKGSRPILLCSASADYVIVWNIELCQRRAQEGKKKESVSCAKLLSSSIVSFIHIKQ